LGKALLLKFFQAEGRFQGISHFRLCWRSVMRAFLWGNRYTEAENSKQGARDVSPPL
jgi:hypothetical protein